MKKALAIVALGSLLITLMPVGTHAGDPHAVRNRWTGAAIGAGTVVLGGLLLGSLLAQPSTEMAPRAIAPSPPVVYSPPPPVVYYSPPPPPPVVYAPAPVIVYREYRPARVPPGHWKRWHGTHRHHGWEHK